MDLLRSRSSKLIEYVDSSFMISYAKLIKEATKPKPGAPKAKYIDPVIASSFTQDGSLQDICRAIAGRLGESNSLVRTLVTIECIDSSSDLDSLFRSSFEL